MPDCHSHRFAAAFLLPPSRFGEEVWAPTLEGFKSLKPYWRASIGTMIAQCEDLGIITAEQIPAERPRLVRRSFQMLVDEGIKTRQQIIYELRLTPSDME